MRPEQKALADYMSIISQQAYCAGWMDKLEHELWRICHSGPQSYGMMVVTDAHIDVLRKLSEACGGWIICDDNGDERFVTFKEWWRCYEQQQLQGTRRRERQV